MRKASKLLLSIALLATFAGGVVVPVIGTVDGFSVVKAEDNPVEADATARQYDHIYPQVSW